MTDKAVSALTSLTGANTATGDLLYIVDISEAAAADRSKKITAEELQNYLKKFPATIGVGGATPAASGAGISFPATASASSDANTLDDYEEGTWQPNLSFSSALSGSFTFDRNEGFYVKVGRFVHVQAWISWTAKPSAGTTLNFSLPFPNKSDDNHRGGLQVTYNDAAFSGITVYGFSFRAESNAALVTANYSSVTDGTVTGTINNGSLPSSGSFMIAGTYVSS